MSIMIGAVIACAVAWLSIFVVLRLNPLRFLDIKFFKVFGGISVVTIALLIWGLDISPMIPLGIFIVGAVVAVIAKQMPKRTSAT